MTTTMLESPNKELNRDFGIIFSSINQVYHKIEFEKNNEKKTSVFFDLSAEFKNDKTLFYLLYINNLFLNHLKITKFPQLLESDIKRNNYLRVDKDQMFLPVGLSRKEQLFISSFILAFFSVYDTRQMKIIEFTKTAIYNFYSQNRKIKIFMNLLILNPSLIRFIVIKKETKQFITDLLRIKLPPRFIYNLLGIYKNTFLINNFSYRLLITELKKQINEIV